MKRPRRVRLVALLLALVLATILPTLGLGAAAVWQAASAGRVAAEARLRDTAGALALALDRDVAGKVAALTAFATSPAFGLDGGAPDLAALDAHARRVAAWLGTPIFLAERDGTRVLSTALPPGAALPPSNATEMLREVFDRGQPVVANLMVGASSGSPVFSVAVPVADATGRVVLAAAAAFRTERLQALLATQTLPPGNFASLADARNVVVARSDTTNANILGQVIPARNVALFEGRQSGIYRAVTLGGAEHVIAFRAMANAPGWTVFVGEQAALFDATWRGPLASVLAGAALALALSAGLAVLVARRLLLPLRRLDTYARGLASDAGTRLPSGAAALPHSMVAEIDALRRGFARAESALAARQAALEASEARLKLAQRAGRIGSFEWVPDTDTITGSEEYAVLHGLRRGPVTEPRASWVARLHPADRALAAAEGARLDSAAPLALDYRIIRPQDGAVRWIAERREIFRDADGAGCRVIGSQQDVTEQREAEAALAESNRTARLAAERVQLALAAGAIVGTWMWHLPTDHFTADERFARSFGLDPETCRQGLGIEAVVAGVHPEDKPRLMQAIAEAIARGGPYSCEYRVRQFDGVYRWIEANGRVDHAPDGSPLRFPGVLIDVERRRATEAERDRATDLLRAFIEAVPGVVYAKDREGRMLVANAGTAALIGKPPEQFLGRTDREFLDDPGEAEVVMANDSRIMEDGRTSQVEERVSLPDGTLATWLSTKAPFRDAAGRIMGLVGASVDITARKQAEDRLRLVVDELNHRVKNTLATVQSIAAQTLRGADPELRRALETRLFALAAAHDVLTREGWAGADIDEVVAGVLAPHGGRDGTRFGVSGPPVRLAPRVAVALSMGLHELATNALKYGALAAPGGRVEIGWSLLPGATPAFRLVWSEHGGPAVATPERRGFGTRLVERGLAQDLGGVVRLDFAADGLVCTIEAPLNQVEAPAEPAELPRLR